MVVAFALGIGGAAADHYGEQKVVYHFNADGGADGGLYRAGLTNIQNHIDMVGLKNLTTKVVLHGNGLNMLKAAAANTALREQIDHLKLQGVEFLVCSIALQRRNIALKELYDAHDEDVVHSGVAEIAHLQKQGYSYIKP
jgi:intracellular sulfur oxidation DsrE/DsrF family protein